jgi:predicted secreted Zn-dependent protease
MKRAILTIFISLLCAEAGAQTLADIARRERERRAAEGAATTAPNVSAGSSAAPNANTPAPAPRPNIITLSAARATTHVDIGARGDDVFKFYDVRGSTAAELRAEIARLGPVSEGTRHQGLTNWRITWQTVTTSDRGKCSATAANVTYAVEIVIPRWVNEVGAPQALSTSWRTYLTGLLRHEHGHRDIAEEGVEEVRRVLKNPVSQATCAAAAAALNGAGKAIVDKTGARQRQYDKDTDHGRGQGVRLP